MIFGHTIQARNSSPLLPLAHRQYIHTQFSGNKQKKSSWDWTRLQEWTLVSGSEAEKECMHHVMVMNMQDVQQINKSTATESL